MSQRATIRIYLLAFMGTVLAAAGGCDDFAFEPVGPARGPGRPAPRPIAGVPATRPAEPAARAVRPAPEPLTESYQQVVLHSEPAPAEPPPDVRYVRLVRAAAGDVGPILSWLHIPSGPAGSHSRYCLVYPTQLEAVSAARAALLLDVPALAEPDAAGLPADPGEAFNRGVGLLYGLGPGQVPDANRARRAEAALARALGSRNLPAETRWAAGILAGMVASEYLYDYEAAERHFAAAEVQAQPGSLEQLRTWLARAAAHIQNGRPQQARLTLSRLLAQFGPLRSTEPFTRADRILADLDRKP